jgi:uncharacterized protein YhaN
MRLVGWHVDGFGTLKDYAVDGLGDGVTLLAGENEAGKSTLLAFLRAMLFGFPKKSTRARQYPPLRGGGHGGHVVLSDDEGRGWTIERYADRKERLSIADAAGVAADESQLRKLLGGADEKLFTSVFAFGLSELKGFDTLDAAGVRERIFSAGITGAGQSARQVVDQLNKGVEALLKQRAGQAQINNLIGELDGVDGTLRTARARDERYAELADKEREKGDELERLVPRLDRLRQRKARVDVLVQSRPDWDERKQVGDELDRLPQIADDALPQRVGELATELTRQRTREERVGDVGMNAARMRDQRREALQRLGADWTAERALAFDDSIGVRDEVRAWGRRLALLDAPPAAAAAFGRRPLAVAVTLASVCAAAALATFVAGFTQLGAGLLAAAVLLAVVGYVAAASRHAGAADADEQIRDDWHAWLAARGLAQLTPAGVTDVLAAIGEARSADGVAAGAERELEDIRRRATDWDLLAHKALAAAGRPAEALTDEDLRAALLTLDEQLQRRAHLAQRLDVIDTTLRQRLDSDPEAMTELASGNVSAWRVEAARLAEETRAVEAQRDAGNEDIGRLRKELEDLATSQAIAQLQTERESLKAELAGKVREYRVLVTARGLIRETLRSFVREHQPDVLRGAGGMFATTTGGRYVGVEAAEGGDGDEAEAVVVISREGKRNTPDQLSRGTAEQLYIAVRLALAADFAGRSTSLPVIIDDCLVNFDPQRQRGIAKAMGEYGAEHQLLLFTCHPETEQIFRDTLGDRLALLRMPPVAD